MTPHPVPTAPTPIPLLGQPCPARQVPPPGSGWLQNPQVLLGLLGGVIEGY